MDIRDIGPSIDRQAVDNLNHNFGELRDDNARQVQAVLRGDASETDPGVNGKLRTNTDNWNTLQDYGMNFLTKQGGVLHSVWVHIQSEDTLGIGIAEQLPGALAGSQIAFKEFSVVPGWNKLILDFPISANTYYTVFKRGRVGVGRIAVTNWSGPTTWDTPNKELQPIGARDLNTTSAGGNVFFFELTVITNIAQAYKAFYEKTLPTPQFYVGNTPPTTSQFWFRPVGG